MRSLCHRHWRPFSCAGRSTNAVCLGSIDRAIHKTTLLYGKVIRQVLRLRYVVLVLFVCGLAGTVYLYNHVPTAFLPTEDQNYLICIVQTPPGASLTYTTDVARQRGQSHPPEQGRLWNLCRHGIQPQRGQLLELWTDLCSA